MYGRSKNVLPPRAVTGAVPGAATGVVTGVTGLAGNCPSRASYVGPGTGDGAREERWDGGSKPPPNKEY